MEAGFEAMLEILREPLDRDRSVRTDNSILLIYRPQRELEFREQFEDHVVPTLSKMAISHRVLNLEGFLLDGLGPHEVEALQEDEVDDFQWLKQGLSKRLEDRLQRRVSQLGAEVPEGAVFLLATVALFPLVRFGEVLRGLRDLDCRVVVAFPGEERGGRLHFMDQPDGGNYLAIKIHVWPQE